MAEIIQCPSCKEKVQVPDNFAGRNVQCPVCSATFVAPKAGGPPAVQPAADAYVEDRPRRRERYDNDDDYDDYEEPDHVIRRNYAPHRAGAVLTLGILSLVMCGPIFGPMAWIMGNTDMREMRAGRMDPSGESSTNAGRICGIIGTCFSIAVLCIYGIIILGAVAGRRGGF